MYNLDCIIYIDTDQKCWHINIRLQSSSSQLF